MPLADHKDDPAAGIWGYLHMCGPFVRHMGTKHEESHHGDTILAKLPAFVGNLVFSCPGDVIIISSKS